MNLPLGSSNAQARTLYPSDDPDIIMVNREIPFLLILILKERKPKHKEIQVKSPALLRYPGMKPGQSSSPKTAGFCWALEFFRAVAPHLKRVIISRDFQRVSNS